MKNEKKMQSLNMATAFYVTGNYVPKEENAAFVKWLEDAGYMLINHEGCNMAGTFYIDVATKTYAYAHSDILLAPIVGNQGLKYEDFKIIHSVFKNRASEEKAWRFRPEYLTPLPVYLGWQEAREKQWEEEREDYFSKNPTFEEWCNDVFLEIKNDRWYKKHWPDYSKKDFNEALSNTFVNRDMRDEYQNREMPFRVAARWDLITF